MNWEEEKNSPGRKGQVYFMSNTWALQQIAISLIHWPWKDMLPFLLLLFLSVDNSARFPTSLLRSFHGNISINISLSKSVPDERLLTSCSEVHQNISQDVCLLRKIGFCLCCTHNCMQRKTKNLYLMKMYTLISLMSLWMDSLHPEPNLKNPTALRYPRTWKETSWES